MRALVGFLAIPLWAGLTYAPGGSVCSSHPCTAIVTCASSPCTNSDIQTALTGGQIQLGDTITIQHGATYNHASSTILPYIAAGAGTITIRTDVSDSQLPPDGTRITPAYAALMPELKITGTSNRVFEVEHTANPTSNYTFIGLNFTSAQGIESGEFVRIWVPPGSDGCSYTNRISHVSATTPMVVTFSSPVAAGCFDDLSHVVIDGIYGAFNASGWFLISNPTHSLTQISLLNYNGSNTVGTGTWDSPWNSGFTYSLNDAAVSNCSGSNKTYLSTANSNLNNSPCVSNWCQIGSGTCGQALGLIGLDTPTVIQSTVQYLSTQTPQNIAFKHILVQGAPLGSMVKGFRLVGRNITVQDSFFDQIKAQADSQSIAPLAGPHTITNNWLGGGPGEHILCGGLVPNLSWQDAGIDPETCHDMILQYNSLYNDRALYQVDNWQQNAWVRAGKIINVNPYFYPVAAAFYSLSASGTIGLSQGTSAQISCNTTLTSTPTISTTGAVNGQILYVINRSGSCVLQDNGTLAGSKLSLTTPPTVTLTAGTGLEFVYNSGSGLWVQTGTVTASGSADYFIATTSGTTGASVPTWPGSTCASQFVCAAGCCVTDGTVIWTKNPLTNPKWTMKNMLEFKLLNLANFTNVVKWNVLDGSWLDGQAGIGLSYKACNQGIAGVARTKFLEFAYNVLRNTSTYGANTSNCDYNYGEESDLNAHDNFLQAGGLNYGASNWLISTGRANTSVNLTPPYYSNYVMTHNTWDRPADATGTFWSIGQCPSATGNGSYNGITINYNLFHMQGTALQLIAPCPGTTQKAAALSAVTNGVSNYSFLGNVVDNGALTNWPTNNYNTAWASIGFANVSGGNPWLLKSSAVRGIGDSGSNLGADVTQLPQIRNLTVTASDRQALLKWSLTAGNQSVPCVVEVSNTRDFTAYISDMDPALSTRPESSANDWLPYSVTGVNLYNRAIIIGKNTPLSASTTYWYRLHCGGDFSIGSFTTKAALPSGTTSAYVSKVQRTASAASMAVDYGTNYSRATNTLSGGGTATATCAVGAVCTTSFPVTHGQYYYQRIRDLDGGGGTLSTGPITVGLAVH